MATIAELLYLFRDGQPNSSIGPEAFQALISELHLATGLFQDMPRSPAGLADGRLYLNGDIVQRAPGSIPASPLGNFLGAGSAVLLANASFTRAAARSSLLGTSALVATPQTLTVTSSTGNFLGSGIATLFANPAAVKVPRDANSLISGAAALSVAPEVWKPGVFGAAGAGAFSADASPPNRAASSTVAGAGALSANVSSFRRAASSTAAGAGALVANVSSFRRAGRSTVAGSAVLAAAPWTRMRAASTMGGSAALVANPSARMRAASTVAGSAAVAANPTSTAFSTAFSSAFGNRRSNSAFSSDFSSAFS